MSDLIERLRQEANSAESSAVVNHGWGNMTAPLFREAADTIRDLTELALAHQKLERELMEKNDILAQQRDEAYKHDEAATRTSNYALDRAEKAETKLSFYAELEQVSAQLADVVDIQVGQMNAHEEGIAASLTGERLRLADASHRLRVALTALTTEGKR